MNKDNATWVLTRFMVDLAIPVTGKTVSEELERHPDYYSLAAFSDVLDRIKVPNAAYKLAIEQLSEVPVPYIAHLSRKEFGVITHFDESFVTVSTERWNNKRFTAAEFKKMYSGAV